MLLFQNTLVYRAEHNFFNSIYYNSFQIKINITILWYLILNPSNLNAYNNLIPL